MSFSLKNAKPCSPSSMSARACRAGTAVIGRRERTIARCASCSRCTTRRFNSWRISALLPSRSTISRACGSAGGRAAEPAALTSSRFSKSLEFLPSFGTAPGTTLVQQLAERELDGAAAAIGAPFPALVQLDAQRIIDFIAPSSEQITSVRKQMPEITPSTIAAGTYRSLTQDYPTIGLYNFAAAHKDLSDDLVYQIVKTVFENHAELVKAHPVAKETIPENIARNTLFPLHPGALRYYREKGVAIPPSVLEGTD